MGWSCPDCENLGMLLGEEETQQIIEEFDRLQRPWDCRIQLDDWLDKKRRDFEDLHDMPLAKESVDQLAEEFGIFVAADDDENSEGSSAITWMDFLGMESLKWLHKQPKSHLVGLLHAREVRRLKEVFAKHDLSGSSETAIGIVDGDGAGKVFEKWLEDLGMSEAGEEVGAARRHSKAKGDYSSSLQTWQAFLLDKALCIIAARPNRVMGGKNYVKFAVELEKRSKNH